MSTDLQIGILAGLLLMVFVGNIRTNYRISYLEYQQLLTTEVLGLKEEGPNSPTAKVARETINKKYKIFQMINDMA